MTLESFYPLIFIFVLVLYGALLLGGVLLVAEATEDTSPLTPEESEAVRLLRRGES